MRRVDDRDRRKVEKQSIVKNAIIKGIFSLMCPRKAARERDIGI